MYQRLDKLNKNAFASMCVFGKSRDAQIQGLWVWRGKELVFPLSPNWQVMIAVPEVWRIFSGAPGDF